MLCLVLSLYNTRHYNTAYYSVVTVYFSKKSIRIGIRIYNYYKALRIFQTVVRNQFNDPEIGDKGYI